MLFFFRQMVTTVWNSTRQEGQIALCKTALPTGYAFPFGGDNECWVSRGCLPNPQARLSYQGDPGTGAEATGLVPLGVLSSLVTRIDGGSCE